MGESGDSETGDTADPQEANYIFVTSTEHSGDLGGIEGADSICSQRAVAANLPGSFVAWLSSSQVDAIDRVVGARGWIRPDGRPFADTPDDLLLRNWYPPYLDELGQQVPDGTLAMTGSRYDGTATDTCMDWTDDSEGSVTTGVPIGGLSEWTTAGSWSCSNLARIYCLGISYDTQVSAPVIDGRLAFVSTDILLGGGIEAADAQCQADAELAGLTGSYLALISTSTASAASRFDLGGPTWVRVDGLPIWDQAADLATERPLTPIFIAANDTLAAQLVWAGAPTPAELGSATCSNWTSTVGTALVGRSTRIGQHAFGGLDRDCAESGAFYCLEQ